MPTSHSWWKHLLLFALLLASTFTPVRVQAQLTRVAATVNLPSNVPPNYELTDALAGLEFSEPMATAYPVGETTHLFILERNGKIWRISGLDTAAPTKALFMDLSGYLNTQNRPLATNLENGMLAIAFHPNYAQNGYFYVYYSITVGAQLTQLHQRLARFKATGTSNYLAATAANPNTETPLLTMHDRASNHNGGDLAFGADGYLYLSLGDEGGGNDQYNNARFINKSFWGQMLRLDVDNKPESLEPNVHSQSASTAFPSAVHAGSYRVPADNPFIGKTTWHGQAIAPTSVRTEIYATGLRNPFRFSFDPPTGRLFVGDVGQSALEEVNLIVKGGDYGWSWREGTLPFTIAPKFPDNLGTTNPPAGSDFTPIEPIITYSRSEVTHGISGADICGGLVYRGSQFPELQGAYLVADIAYGYVAAFRETSPGVWTGEYIADQTNIVDFGVNPNNGEVLMCSLISGKILQLKRAPPSNVMPSRLSLINAFSDLTALTPRAGLVSYSPNVSSWDDYAEKRRWFGTKNLVAGKITYRPTANWSFPVGSVWFQHFDLNVVRGNASTKKKIETRVLFKNDTGLYGLTYKWREDQTDADLVDTAGLTEVIPGSSPAQTWRYPSRTDCKSCHTTASGGILSMNTAQLNGIHPMVPGSPQNQISTLVTAGYLTTPTAGYQHALSPASSTTASLEWRARSYLHTNCAECHQPGVTAPGTWDARYIAPTAESGLLNGPLVTQGSDAANRMIVPGDASHSMLLLRMQGAHSLPRMPSISNNERDIAGEALITEWISALASYQTLTQWLQQHFGSTTTPASQPLADPDGDGMVNELEYAMNTDPNSAASKWTYNVVSRTTTDMVIRYVQPPNVISYLESSPDLLNWTIEPPVDGYLGYQSAPIDRLTPFIFGQQARRFMRVRFYRP